MKANAGEWIGLWVGALALGIGSASPGAADESRFERPGERLRPGMRLVYSADGKRSPPWRVHSVVADRKHPRCAELKIAYGPGEPAYLRRECIADGWLFIDEGSGFSPARPVAARDRLERKNPSGAVVTRYETGEWTRREISGSAIPALRTEVLFFDAQGRVEKRLRELYSVGLGTAVEGVFEVPLGQGRWKAIQRFKLEAILPR